MATFQERLHKLEETRRERSSHLQAEKQLQAERSRILNEKIAAVRFLEQRCLLLEKRCADLGFQISAKKSEIDAADAKYQASAQQFRVLKRELDELEVREKENDRLYEARAAEMEEFKERVRRRVADARLEVECMRNSVSEDNFWSPIINSLVASWIFAGLKQARLLIQLRSTLNDLQDNDGYLNSSEIAAAERKNTELLAIKEDLDNSLASNYHLRLLLQKQLQKILA